MLNMPPTFWVAMLTAFVLGIVSPFAMILVLLLTPGRKGFMRTERTVAHDGMSLPEARLLYSARLRHERFDIIEQPDARQIVAKRAGAPASDSRTHAEKPMAIDIAISEERGRVNIRVVGRMTDFIVLDSGEKRHVEQTLHRLLNEDLDNEPASVVQETSSLALMALVMVPISASLMMWLIARGVVNSVTSGMFTGTIIACLMCLGMARQANQKILQRPDGLRGAGLVRATYALASLVCAFGLAMLYLRFGGPIYQEFKAVLAK